MFQLRQQTEQMQRRLKEAEDIRYAKEGEVTMLRQKMTKVSSLASYVICIACSWIIQTAQEHNSSIARLQASKAEAEAKQAQMQREMNEEMERLRTQFHFKVRKPNLVQLLTYPLMACTSISSNMNLQPHVKYLAPCAHDASRISEELHSRSYHLSDLQKHLPDLLIFTQSLHLLPMRVQILWRILSRSQTHSQDFTMRSHLP